MGATFALGCDHEWAVLDEGSLVDEVGQVLTGGAAPTLAPPGDGVGAGDIQPELAPSDQFGQVLAIGTGRHLGGGRRGGGLRLVRRDWFDIDDRGSRLHGGALADQDRTDPTGDPGHHVVVELHRLDECDHRPFAHHLPLADEDRDDGALELGVDGVGHRPMMAAALAPTQHRSSGQGQSVPGRRW